MNGLHVGVAGWSIPRAVVDAFPSEGSALQRYAAVFDCAEINSSFYKPHKPETYARWAASVGEHFRFAVKLPKAITHEARLVGCEALMDRFAGEAGALGSKLGCVLVQLPPSLVLDLPVARAALASLRERFDCLLACEARHGTWFGEDANALLREFGVTRVIADPAVGVPGPYIATAPKAYVRLHGSPRIYWSSYEPERLAQVREWLGAQASAWCIFDNTASGAAMANALDLRASLQQPSIGFCRTMPDGLM
ncbi:DUF72 domain-containing protein [Pseudoduganella sp. UC29_106]|uniref:DUF72 domain-containing protein n=1 Tax=Pseudoduganella sp. UC29_106 TaxID=3374553 RepID=UPI00375681DD